MKTPFDRKTPLQKAGNAVEKAAHLPKDKGMRAGLVAAGSLAGVTAASAGISSLRRRKQGASDNS